MISAVSSEGSAMVQAAEKRAVGLGRPLEGTDDPRDSGEPQPLRASTCLSDSSLFLILLLALWLSLGILGLLGTRCNDALVNWFGTGSSVSRTQVPGKPWHFSRCCTTIFSVDVFVLLPSAVAKSILPFLAQRRRTVALVKLGRTETEVRHSVGPFSTHSDCAPRMEWRTHGQYGLQG